MKYVHGKRQVKQEKIFGFVLVTVSGIRTFGVVIGRTCWGLQWTIKQKKTADAKFIASLRALKKSTESESSGSCADSETTKTDSATSRDGTG